MSAMANSTPVMTTVRNTDGREKTPTETDTTPQISIQEFCEKHYDDILPIIMEKARQDKRKGLQSRLDFGDTPKRARRIRSVSLSSGDRNLPARYYHRREKSKTDAKRKDEDRRIARVGKILQVVEIILRTGATPESEATSVVSKSLTARPTPPKRLGTEIAPAMMVPRGYEEKEGKRIPILSCITVPWTYEDVDPFTPRIHNFRSSRKTRMPNKVKTYDGTGDPEDHLKVFQAAAQVEHWAMPTWCHMFNFTLIGAARVWFDELPAESIDGYKDLKAAFLSYFMQQKKYVKDPVEIHNIKEKDGETIEEFMKRCKTEAGRIKGAPECMPISGFMHGVNNYELTKRLNERVPKTMEEMMTTTASFIQGKLLLPPRRKEGRGSNKFTPLTRTPKEIFTAEASKFKPRAPMVTPLEKRSDSSKFCEFHNDKGHNTNECVQLKKQIEELVRAGKLSQFVKGIRQEKDQQRPRKKDFPTKDKAAAIYMIQSWQRVTR
ncbi:reverse transcriptase domain-containing protein [Tanacetum coccineum]